MEKKLHEECVYNGKIFNVYHNTVLTEGMREEYRDIISHNGGVGIIPLDNDGNVYLVKQYRSGAGETLLEIPAGKLEDGEEPVICAARELSEETGFEAESLSYLGFIYPTPAYDTEKIHLFKAENLKAGTPHPDDGEVLGIVKMKVSDAVSMALGGEITDAKTVVALLRTRGDVDE